MKTALLCFTLIPRPLYWLFTGSGQQIHLLEKEVHAYNTWIGEFLVCGLAPNTAYSHDCVTPPCYTEQVLHTRRVCDDREYALPYLFYYALVEDGCRFRIVVFDELHTDLLLDCYEGSNPMLTLETPSALASLITRPYGRKAFGMGYKVLPMTAHFLEKL
jgi:hypothetical protein